MAIDGFQGRRVADGETAWRVADECPVALVEFAEVDMFIANVCVVGVVPGRNSSEKGPGYLARGCKYSR